LDDVVGHRLSGVMMARPLSARRIELAALEQIVGSMPCHLDMFDPNYRNMVHSVLMYGGLGFDLPRLDVTLSAMFGHVARLTGKTADQFVAVEHEPGISLSAMAAMARSGVQVKWTEENPSARFQTGHIIETMPKPVRDRIELAQGGFSPDIAVANMPHDDANLDRIAYGAGLVAVQSRRDAAWYLGSQAAQGSYGLVTSFGVSSQNYVFPSAHFGAAGTAPTFFHIFQKV
jgi:hypothetical protein